MIDCGTGGSTELLCSGGAKGTGGRLPDHGDRKGNTPHHVAARVRGNFSLTLGMLVK